MSENYGGSFGPIRKVSYDVPISRDMAIAHGLIQPTPADVERERQWRQKHDAEMAVWRDESRKADRGLAAIGDPLRAVLDLHSRSDIGDCEGCDYSGYEGDPPAWPCRTVELIAAASDVRLPFNYVAP